MNTYTRDCRLRPVIDNVCVGYCCNKLMLLNCKLHFLHNLQGFFCIQANNVCSFALERYRGKVVFCNNWKHQNRLLKAARKQKESSNLI